MVFRRLLKLSALFAIRDWRAGQLNLLFASLVLAVAAVTSTGFFVDRMRLGLNLDAAQLLGADWVVSADAPLPQVWADRARALGLGVARAVSFPSMAISGNDPMTSTLVAVKAVSSPYPLRGALRIKGRLEAEASARQSGPPAGAVWVDPALLAGLGLAVGDRIELGDALLRIDGLIALEPDRGMAFLNLAPRVMLGEADLAATGLVAAGSRVTYRLLVAGEPSALEVFRGEVSSQLLPGQRVESLASGQSRFERIFERAQRFLSLVSLLTVLLATVAVAVAARRFAQRHVQACALLRCLGLTQRALMTLLGLEFFWLALLAGALGIGL
ncbi:MAG TPA: ABC transporter permease, partial [Burkholderiaceae bacterium]|nr:ABC transporter permease [Burkholderiaceae bacterium]